MTRDAPDASSFGVVLQRLRRRTGLSQQELAERASLSLRGIADLERGARRRPYPATVRRLADALELNEADRAALVTSAALDTWAAHPTQDSGAPSLPYPLSSFIGREREKAAVQHLLEKARLVTLTGTGGIGKTRLAVEVAGASGAVTFVDLAPVADGELVAAAVAEAIGIRKQPSVPLETLLTRWLASRSLLLVLDNCEHLLQNCAQLVDVLLRTCPGLRILATSRERLGIPGEMSWRVPSLPVPESDWSMGRVLECEAVRLFLERAIAVSSGFSFTPQNAAAVVTLIRRLDGIPLAIELAAARVNVLSVEQIASRLDHAVRLLVGGSTIAPARQQTLRATFEWSYGLLSEDERLLFARLSVFAGGWTLEAAEQVGGDSARQRALGRPCLDRAHILDVLGQLIDKSLVLSQLGGADELRYRLLEPVRQFAAECLVHQGAAAVLRDRHARWCTDLATRSAAQYHGPNESAALERLEREHANIQAAFDWLLDQPARRDEAVRLAHGVWWFWAARDHWTEATSRLNRLLDGLRLDDAAAPEVDLLWMAGSIAWMCGDLALASQWIEQCLTVGRQRNQQRVLAWALGIAAQLAAARGDYATARQLGEEGLPLARDTGERWSEARYLDGLALLAIEQGKFDEAAKWLTSSLAAARAMGDAWSEAAALNKLGDVARGQRDYAGAGRLYEESLLRLEGQGDELRASVLHNLGYVAIAEGDQARAAALFAQSLRMCHARGDQRGVAECLVGFGCLAAATDRSTRAARLFGAADATFQLLGVELSPSNRTDYARGLEMARAGDNAAFVNAYDAGQALSLDEAAREAFRTDASCEPVA
jgi:predicted ATPase/DNA-binding XRE family transcriptional regulator